MRRTAPTLPVNAKMYRHFAVISLTLTAGLAMFANTGPRDALEEHAAKNAESNRAAPKKIASNFKDNRKDAGSFGQEAGSALAGAQGHIASTDIVVGPDQVAGSQVTLVSGAPAALPVAAVNGLPPGMTQEEIRAWQARHRRPIAPESEPDQPSASDIAAIVAASKARSRMGSDSLE